ncbi:MAG: glycosyltransferase family 2 protein [Tepidisphaeraceae bacterium]
MAVANSIIIVNFNAKAALSALLTTMRLDEATVTETIVVDSNSFDGSADFVRQSFPQVKVVQCETNTGFAAAANRGIREAEGDVAVLVQSDVLATVHVLTELCDFVREGRSRRIAAAIPRILGPDMQEQPTVCLLPGTMAGIIGAFAPSRAIRCDTPSLDHVADHEYATAVCMALDLAALARVGDFDESFFLHYADADLCLRLHEKQFRIVVAKKLSVVHETDARQAPPAHLERLIRKGQMRFFEKHRGGIGLTMVRAAMKVAGWMKKD